MTYRCGDSAPPRSTEAKETPIHDMTAVELEKALSECKNPKRRALLLYALTEHRNWEK